MSILVRHLFLTLCGAGFGLLASAGVFTVFVTVGLVPRFAGRTHTADKILLYEEMVIWGTVTGGFVSVFDRYSQFAKMARRALPALLPLWEFLGWAGQLFFGVFGGIFVGCLALAIAEMLDSIPIFTRRLSLQKGLSPAILAIALGKLCGSLFYFWIQLHRVVE